LELNQPCELFVVRNKVTNQVLLALNVKRGQCNAVRFNYSLKLENHLIAVSLSTPQVKFGVVDVVLVSAAENFC
jgi:hypothetical protein